jgi:ATP-binding cassette subfamily A (ABC1) protein 3
MDEAENLADRVAIVSKGKLECCGSTLFLKDKYTKGFFIEIEKANSEPMPMLEQLLEKYTAKAGIFGWNFEIGINESGATTYTLPKEVGNYFSEIFKEIDFDLAKFGISKYRVRSANLEEVFIAIGEKEHKVVDEIIPDDESRRSSTQTRRFYSKEK